MGYRGGDKELEKPPHVVELAMGGHVCLHCGGEVGADGMAAGYEDEGSDEEPVQQHELEESFAKAVRGK